MFDAGKVSKSRLIPPTSFADNLLVPAVPSLPTIEQGGGFPERTSAFVNTLRVVRERWWIVVLAALACGGAALAYSLQQTKEYEATARLLFRNPQFGAAIGGADVFSPSNDPTRDASTNVALVTALPVARSVQRELRIDRAPVDLLDQTTAELAENSDIVNVTVVDEDPALAARIANSFVTQFVAYRKRTDRQKIAEGEALIRTRLDSLPPSSAAERNSLQDALQRLIALEAVQTGNAEPVDQARVPDSPAYPNTKLDALLGFLVGGLIGVGVIFLLDVLDRRVKTVEDFERYYHRRALVTLPQRVFTARRPEERSMALEPFRILRSSIEFQAPTPERARTLVVTSSIASTGKTTVSIYLARAAAVADLRTVVVECDLRRPGLQRHVPIERGGPGLTNVLVGVKRLEDVLVPHEATLDVLPAGPLPPNPAELLRGHSMQEVLARLAEMYDMIVLDAPPLLPVADARILLNTPQVDTCIHVVRAYQETRSQARQTREIFEQHRLQPLGLVVTGLRESGGSDYSTYEYASEDAGSSRKQRRAEKREPVTSTFTGDGDGE